ncbi:MAG: VPS10 domain-containing protein [Gemmatimonadales bacterium]
MTPVAPAIEPALYERLQYRHVGPEGNRLPAVAGVPGDPLTYYAGAASGGIWKSSDGGVHWNPIFDGQPVSSIGALAVAPSDPNVVWAGTGESFIRSHISVGWGVWKSTDAGKSWSKMGLDRTGRIARIVIDPRNPDVVLLAALGHAYGPQPERGIFRTADGGKTWEKVLFVNDSTGAIDIVMDPSNPRILYAATWQIEIHTWGRTSGGKGSGIWKSTDGGSTWKRLEGNGLPTKPFGKVGLAVARSAPNRVYALIETSDGVPLPGFEPERGELWRSDDAGGTWQVVSYDRELAGRTHYYTRMTVAPDNAEEGYFLSGFSKTLDGGKTTIDIPFTNWPGWDHHDMWIDPTNGNRIIVGSDCCVSVSVNRGQTWLQRPLPVAQMYHVTTDNQVPYWVYGNRQDGPSAKAPSNSKTGGIFGPGNITRGMWGTVGGGESGWATPDPEDPNIVWSSASGFGAGSGIVVRYDARTGTLRDVEVWPEAPIGTPARDLKYRFVWNFPLTLSPHDRNKVYVGSQHVHATTNGGQSWQVISPDLTRNDRSRMGISGGLTPDNIGVEYAGVVFAIAESRVMPGLIWAGTNDGLVHLTRDGGKTWAEVTGNIPGLIEWGTIANIQPSRYDAGTAYLTVDGHQANNRDPWVYQTTDYGKTWRLITGGLEKSPLSYAHVVREDPVRRGLLYLGTENGLYVSFDDGQRWQPLQTNLSHAPVYEILVQEHFNDLVVGTYGRGIWILDDITPLQQLTPELAAKPVHLFTQRPAYRFRLVEPPFSFLADPVEGKNPPYGAGINYWLGSEATDSVTLTISDASGAVVRTLKGPKNKGLNRVVWNLQLEPTKVARLRTPPRYAPEIPVPDTGRVAPDIGRQGILAPPGTYTVKLRSGSQEAMTQLVVRKDPNSGGSEAGITAQTALLKDIAARVNEGVDVINSIETVRAQLASLRNTLRADSATRDVQEAADSLEEKLIGVEGELTQLLLTGRGQDGVRYPSKLISQFLYLWNGVAAGEFEPTDQQREVYQGLSSRLQEQRSRAELLLNRDVPAFSTMLRNRNLRGVISRSP